MYSKKSLPFFFVGFGAVHFLIALVAIIYSAFFRDMAITRFYNRLFLPNYIYYGFASMLIAFGLMIPNKYITWKEKHIDGIVKMCLFSSIVLIVAISAWIDYRAKGDFPMMYLIASSFPSNLDSHDVAWYFQRFPYQLNLTTLFGVILHIIHSWRAIVVLSGFLALLSSFLAYKTVIRITGSKKTATLTMIVLLLMLLPNWRTFFPYTDIWSMVFPITMIYLYTTSINTIHKIFLIAMCAGVGYLIKATILIPCIAITITELLFTEKKSLTSKNVNAVVLTAIVATCLFGFVIPRGIQRVNHFTPNPDKEFGITFFFYLGQNEQFGINNVDDINFSESLRNKEVRQKVCFEGALKRISDRGLLGNIKFYVGKLIVATEDGLFSSPQMSTFHNWANKEKDTFPGFFLIRHGRYFQLLAGFEQVLWNGVLLLLLFAPFFYKDKNTVALSFTFIGYMLYLLIFENRAKYLFVPIPLFVLLASITLWRLRHSLK